MVGKIFIAILALVLMFGFSSVISGGIHDLRTDEITEYETVPTGGAETEKDVTLDRELFKGTVDQVKSITSDLVPTEYPKFKSYTSPVLTVKDLTPDETRELKIIYYSEIDDPYMAIIGPFLGFIIFGGIIFALVWGIWKRR